jgi:hypothetical protein
LTVVAEILFVDSQRATSVIRLHSSRTTWNMPDIRKLPFGIKNRRRDPDEWDKTIVAFQSPYRLKELCVDQE